METDVYLALRQRIRLFETFVGRLQPILARLPRELASVTLCSDAERERARQDLVNQIGSQVEEAEAGGFDLDEVTLSDLEDQPEPHPPYGLEELGRLLTRPDLLPPGIEVRPAGGKDFAYREPGMATPVRVTTDARYYDDHADSVELWSPGSPLFPEPSELAAGIEVAAVQFHAVLSGGQGGPAAHPGHRCATSPGQESATAASSERSINIERT